MKLFLLACMTALIALNPCYTQVGINSENTDPDRSAMLDIRSTSKGLLIPRMTQQQIQTITNPVNSLLVFCTDNNTFYSYISSAGHWKEVLFGTGALTPTCGVPFTDVRDGKIYSTVQIGTQCWMAQNLNVGTRINDYQTPEIDYNIEKYCFNNLESNCDIYGGLYNWSEMMQYSTTPGVQGICPTGWHVPTDAEFTALTTYLGGISVAGGKMKEAGIAHWTSPNTGATDESGFTALPAATRNYNGGFGPLNNRGAFWSSTVNGEASYNCSFNIDLYYNNDDVDRQGGAMWSNGFSVRCLKN